MRFREASLLTKEKFEIHFLEKIVPPGSSLYGGFLVHAVGFWSMQRVSGPCRGFLPVGTAPWLEFCLDPALERPAGEK